ncbi:MAG: hypothetical protein GY822_15130 [Deltaproteobacteria bacterium]|nr:hypothetical protein [Deltaproteobacteria bacterium]
MARPKRCSTSSENVFSQGPRCRRQQPILALALFSFLSFCSAFDAQAHLGVPEGRIPILQDNSIVGTATNWGIVLLEDERWMRTCEESAGASVLFYHRAQSGKIFVGTGEGLLTTDNGCSYDDVPELSGSGLSGLGVALLQPNVFAVSTANTDGRNFIWRSDDDGVSFTDISPVVPDELAFTSLRMGPSGQRIYATGIDYGAAEGVDRNHFFMTSDGGMSWEKRTLWDESNALLVVGVTEDRVGIVAQKTSESHFFRAALDVETLPAPGVFQGVPLDWVVHGAKEYFVLNRQRLFSADVNGPFSEDENGPARCLVQISGDDRLFGCGQTIHFGHILSLDVGSTEWVPHIPFLSVEERHCPLGTVGAERCAYLFTPDAGVVDYDAGTSPSPSPEPDGPVVRVDPEPELPTDCSCTTSQRPFTTFYAALLFIAFINLRTRRKRPVQSKFLARKDVARQQMNSTAASRC